MTSEELFRFESSGKIVLSTAGAPHVEHFKPVEQHPSSRKVDFFCLQTRKSNWALHGFVATFLRNTLKVNSISKSLMIQTWVPWQKKAKLQLLMVIVCGGHWWKERATLKQGSAGGAQFHCRHLPCSSQWLIAPFLLQKGYNCVLCQALSWAWTTHKDKVRKQQMCSRWKTRLIFYEVTTLNEHERLLLQNRIIFQQKESSQAGNAAHTHTTNTHHTHTHTHTQNTEHTKTHLTHTPYHRTTWSRFCLSFYNFVWGTMTKLSLFQTGTKGCFEPLLWNWSVFWKLAEGAFHSTFLHQLFICRVSVVGPRI